MGEPSSVPSTPAGDERHSADALIPLVYQELRRLAAARLAREQPGISLQATALVHEAYLRLAEHGGAKWDNRGHFFAAAAEAMRRILVERARARTAAKRGGDLRRLPLQDAVTVADSDDFEILALDSALERLSQIDPHAAEIVKLRYFGGLTMEQTAAALEISPRSAYYSWEYARAWLRRDLRQGGTEATG